MEGDFCKIIIYKIRVSNQSFIFMKQNKKIVVLWIDFEAITIFKCFQFPLNVKDVITQYWMYFVG